MLAVVSSAATGPAQREPERPLAGRQAGTERWLVELNTRGFDLGQQMQVIRATASRSQREALVAQLDPLATNDQRDMVAMVQALGGSVERHFWVVNALVVEIPPAALMQLGRHPRVRRLLPVVGRSPAGADVEAGGGGSMMPIGPSTDENNHCVAAARQILGDAALNNTGAGVTVAFFDTGVDADADGQPGTVTPHPTFLDGGSPAGTRILAHLMAGNIDCNNIPGSQAYQPCTHSRQARHGTGVAAVAVGRRTMDPLAPTQVVSEEGHAPDASLVDVSVIRVSTNPQTGLPNPATPWATDTATMLAAIQALRAFILTGQPVHVANISFDGWSNADDPVSLAFDVLALEEDVLLVTSAGNAADETFLSNGFYHGLAVGCVHTRTNPAGALVPMGDTSRGPLSSNWSRLYPDVCATGAGVATNYVTAGNAALLTMPLLDLYDAAARAGCPVPVPPEFTVTIPQGPRYFARGTSQAAPHVAGAAALYRGARPAATAEETRAAILLNTISPLPGPNGSGQHTYMGRNTYGVGYVRDDLLAEFAARLGSINPLHQVVQLTAAASSATITYPVVAADGPAAVAVCWRREDQAMPLPDIDLNVWAGSQASGTLLARSATTGNSYERVAFTVPPGVTTVTIQVNASSLVSAPIPVQVVAREFGSTGPQLAVTGGHSSIAQLPGCSTTAPDLAVTRIVPAIYGGAYGSRAFVVARQDAASPMAYRGMDLVAGGTPGGWLHFEVDVRQTGAPDPVVFGALALRTWRPFQVTGALAFSEIWLDSLPGQAAGALGTPATPSSTATQFLGPFQVTTAPPTWSVLGFDSWPIIIDLPGTWTYPGAGNLHVWFRYPAAWPNPIPVIEVDGIQDGPNAQGYAAQALSWTGPGGTTTQRGWGLVLGLAPGDGQNPISVPPRLRLIGEPCLGQTVLMDLTQGSPSQGAFLMAGTAGQAPFGANPQCLIQVVSPTSTFGLIDAAGHGSWTVAVPPNPALLFSETSLQVVVGQPSPLPPVLSNGVVIRLGGAL